jgi:hypothetical protein
MSGMSSDGTRSASWEIGEDVGRLVSENYIVFVNLVQASDARQTY